MELLLLRVKEMLKDGTLLLLIGEGRTLYRDFPMVKMIDLDLIPYVELPGWGILPEEMLACLETCYQKLIHV
jgi:hypothetical protein